MKQIPTSLITLVTGLLVAIISYWVGQHHGLMPTPASEQAAYVDKFFNTMMTIATALFLVVEGAILISVIWFRRKAGEEGDAEPIEGNVPLEVFWTLIPAVIVIGLGCTAWMSTSGWGVWSRASSGDAGQSAHTSGPAGC
ncbi:MAG: hypothetical protein HC921_16810 [Synechococcaceae cyanobacterium SM2_3_1]|nr:hypothetical protein [Synechococcaceae cyanobacterium SM2_3_1]